MQPLLLMSSLGSIAFGKQYICFPFGLTITSPEVAGSPGVRCSPHSLDFSFEFSSQLQLNDKFRNSINVCFLCSNVGSMRAWTLFPSWQAAPVIENIYWLINERVKVNFLYTQEITHTYIFKTKMECTNILLFTSCAFYIFFWKISNMHSEDRWLQ